MKDGTTVPIEHMSDSHLLSTISLFERLSEKGITIRRGGGGPDPDDMWYDEEELFGDDALHHFGYGYYVSEARRRSLSWK